MAILAILGLAIGLQGITAIVVRRLMRVTGRSWGWVALAAVVVLLTGWRCAVVLQGVFGGVSAQLDLATEGLVLLISLCMVSGLAGIASLMLSIRQAQEAAEEALSVRIEQMRAVHTIAEEITRELDFATLPPLDRATGGGLAGCRQTVSIYLWDEATHTLRPRAWCNAGEWMSDVRLRPVKASWGRSPSVVRA